MSQEGTHEGGGGFLVHGETQSWGTVRVLLPPSSSDLWGVCGRRRRLQEQEVQSVNYLMLLKCSRSSEVISSDSSLILGLFWVFFLLLSCLSSLLSRLQSPRTSGQS